jgi:hypothetical protein
MAPSHLFGQRYKLPAIALAPWTAPSAATESSPPAAAAASARLLGTRFIHRQCAAAHIRAIERRNRGLRLGIRGHFHESKGVPPLMMTLS